MSKTKKIVFGLFLLLTFGVLFGQTSSIELVRNKTNEKLSLLDYSNLLKTKTLIRTNKLDKAYESLLGQANIALSQGVFSVVDKTQVPPSGDKHDYITYGPYWWPNPKKNDGLPWIRKDGEINPLTRKGNTDFETKEAMFANVSALSLAYFFSDEEKYGAKTLELLKVWFLNEATKMNPNLNYAQGIPGVNSGRGIGIIEFAGVINILTAIEILELKNAIDESSSKCIRKWFSQYLDWLQTSKNGVFEKNTKNNHAVWYDVQVVSILTFLNRIDEAKVILEEVKTKRIEKQIKSDGKQPHELARTKSLSYSTMNLKGFTNLAYLGSKTGVDLWNYKAKNGASIQKAFEFLKPFALGEKKWTFKQIKSIEKSKKKLKLLFVMAGSLFDKEEYCSIGKEADENIGNLLFNCN